MSRISSLLSSLLVCMPCGALAQLNINFDNDPQLSYHDRLYFLRLPIVDDFYGKPGQYQDMTIQYSPETHAWQLVGFRRGDPIFASDIDAVNVIVAGDVPVQVFLEVTGAYEGCSRVGEAGIRRNGEHFEVQLYHSKDRATSLCAGRAVYTFREIVPLDVYGLPAKTYTYRVNETFSGSFTLSAENVLR